MLFYLIGIKGSALSALAKILSNQGHIVRGVDVEEDFYTISRNTSFKIENFSNMNLSKAYYYIIGNAYVTHSVTKYIQKMHYHYEYYPLFLAKFFKNKKWISIAGTSGKTTTTKMLATIVPDATALIGDGSYQVGKEDCFILESCEYKNTFLNYHPHIALILNINYDHIDFFKTKEEYEASFLQFMQQSKICVVNGDEIAYRDEHILTFGRNENNDVIFSYDSGKVTILRKTFDLPMKGIKYAYDFVGAYVVSKLLNVKDYQIQNRMKQFKMPKRRFECTSFSTQNVISDYAHHPEEIRTIYEALKEQYPNQKKICIFEPHTITRLQYFIEEYKLILSLFDECYLYALFSSARESHNIILEKELYKALGFKSYDYYVQQQVLEKKNAVICFLGAGTIDRAYEEYKKLYLKKD